MKITWPAFIRFCQRELSRFRGMCINGGPSSEINPLLVSYQSAAANYSCSPRCCDVLRIVHGIRACHPIPKLISGDSVAVTSSWTPQQSQLLPLCTNSEEVNLLLSLPMSLFGTIVWLPLRLVHGDEGISFSAIWSLSWGEKLYI